MAILKQWNHGRGLDHALILSKFLLHSTARSSGCNYHFSGSLGNFLNFFPLYCCDGIDNDSKSATASTKHIRQTSSLLGQRWCKNYVCHALISIWLLGDFYLACKSLRCSITNLLLRNRLA